ncbi:MAG TPA: c-type cytochrome [Casimicrobiaceae bacterium]|nr:c-type cytochrome [Casimicrobiaceae bacterium]
MPKHVVRLLLLLAAFLVVAIVVQQLLTDSSFYRFGHYRGDSVAEIASREPAFKTANYCKDCHAERHAQWSANSHKSVACETCHGPAQGHPENRKLPIPADTVKLCTLCHEAMPGRPRTQPQIAVAQHGGGQQCITCHNPHSPKIAIVQAKAEGDAAAGRRSASACAACHGSAGISSNDTWPTLAGQHAAYLVRILTAYKTGDQKDVAMTPLAQTLGVQDIQNLAAFFSGLSCQAPSVKAATGDAAAGKALAKNCAACHGDSGISSNPAWPNLAGQKPGYVVNALKAFRAGLRKDPTMAGVARGLSDNDMANLAAYYTEQPCGPAK